jgi:hypothetical protein
LNSANSGFPKQAFFQDSRGYRSSRQQAIRVPMFGQALSSKMERLAILVDIQGKEVLLYNVDKTPVRNQSRFLPFQNSPGLYQLKRLKRRFPSHGEEEICRSHGRKQNHPCTRR